MANNSSDEYTQGTQGIDSTGESQLRIHREETTVQAKVDFFPFLGPIKVLIKNFEKNFEGRRSEAKLRSPIIFWPCYKCILEK